jgi:hypothetical protein
MVRAYVDDNGWDLGIVIACTTYTSRAEKDFPAGVTPPTTAANGLYPAVKSVPLETPPCRVGKGNCQ